MSNNPDWSYLRHKSREEEHISDDYLPSSITSPESIDAWRHNRMRKTVLPLIKYFPAGKWMTVGDGGFGTDAKFLEENGADVLATSLTDATLKIARQRGYISKCDAQNAECITYKDNTFDFVYCKEAYHHFPRPAIGFYEMLRVASKAVVLIEPIESGVRPLKILKSVIKNLMRGDKTQEYEESGNFIYRISQREIEKMLSALNFEIFAMKQFNDFYHPRLSHSVFNATSLKTKLTRIGILIQDILCKFGLLGYGIATIIIFKEVPSEELKQNMKADGYKFIKLPENIYLKEG